MNCDFGTDCDAPLTGGMGAASAASLALLLILLSSRDDEMVLRGHDASTSPH